MTKAQIEQIRKSGEMAALKKAFSDELDKLCNLNRKMPCDTEWSREVVFPVLDSMGKHLSSARTIADEWLKAKGEAEKINGVKRRARKTVGSETNK